jgi:hypothetical protein
MEEEEVKFLTVTAAAAAGTRQAGRQAAVKT